MMPRFTKWKLEKHKIKVAFRLQFYATQIPQSRCDKLFISFIPVDIGKTTSKTSKANVRNGICKWADPIYETTQLLQDAKTKHYDDKLCRLVVSMGSSRSSIFGEASINLSDYADAAEPSAAYLPLHGGELGAVLHVTVQLLTSKTDFREFTRQRELGEWCLQAHPFILPELSGGKALMSEETSNDQIKENARYGLEEKSSHSSFNEELWSHDEYPGSVIGFDCSFCTHILTTEKHNASILCKEDVLKGTNFGTSVGQPINQNPWLEKEDKSDHQFMGQESKPGSSSWISDQLTLNNMPAVCVDNNRLVESNEVIESSILNSEIEHETKQHSKEMSMNDDDMEQLGVSKFCFLTATKEIKQNNGLFQCLLLKHLREKAQQSMLSVLSVDACPEKFWEMYMCRHQSQCSLDPGSHGFGCADAACAKDAKVMQLLKDLDESKTKQEALSWKMHEMQSCYEASVQTLKGNQEILLLELQNLRNENLVCLHAVSSSKAEKETMCKDLNDEIRHLHSINEELEWRAVSAEAGAVALKSALKRECLRYSIVVDQLQKNLIVLCCQVSSVFGTDEKLVAEASADGCHHLISLKEIETGREGRSDSGENRLVSSQNHHSERELVSVDSQKFSQLPEGGCHMKFEEVDEFQFQIIYLDVLSNMLRAALLKSNDNLRLMEFKMNELVVQEKTYETKYEMCAMEKENLERSLEKRILENEMHQNEIFALQKELKNVNFGFDELASAKENLQNFLCNLQRKLQSLLTLYDESILGLHWGVQCTDLTHVMVGLEALQFKAFEKICHLMEEKKDMVRDRDDARQSVAAFESKISLLEEGLEREKLNMIDKLYYLSEASLVNLQVKIDSTVKKLEEVIYGAEEKYTYLINRFFSAFDQWDDELHDIACQNEELGLEIFSLRRMSGEGGRSKIVAEEVNLENQVLKAVLIDKNTEITELVLELKKLKERFQYLSVENHALMASSQGKSAEAAQLKLELTALKENLQFLHDENQAMIASSRDKKMMESVKHDASDLNLMKKRFRSLHDENKELIASSLEKMKEVSCLKSEINSANENLQILHVQNQDLKVSLESKAMEFQEVLSVLSHLKENVQDFVGEKETFTTHLADESQIVDLWLSKEEVEIMFLILKTKLEEQKSESQPSAMPESLRIMFIKEQYESKLHDMKLQLSLSKKHAQELLWRLQDALDEIEGRKKSEAAHLKKNEELRAKVMNLEVDLGSALSEKKAEMECSVMALDFCKEDKCHKVEDCLRECDEEKSKILDELRLAKELAEDGKPVSHTVCGGGSEFCKMGCLFPDGLAITEIHQNCPIADALSYGRNDKTAAILNGARGYEEAEHVKPKQVISGGANWLQIPGNLNQKMLMQHGMKHLTLVNDYFRAKSLKSSLNQFHHELERMKHDNLHKHGVDGPPTKFSDLEREISHIKRANEELGKLFPMFDELPKTGNALEQLLDLEIELAERLQNNKTSSVHFQSSFTKKHHDKEAIFRTFKATNELIKDMIEQREDYSALESELREMRGCYSQLSLRFAEVEGARQKLVMTLKNVRVSSTALQPKCM